MATWRQWWAGRRARNGPTSVPHGREAGPQRVAPPAAADREAGEVVRVAFWVILWRPPSESESRESVRALEMGQTFDQLVERLLVSTEFRQLRQAVLDDGHTGRSRRVVSAALDDLGGHGAFVDDAYGCLLGREPDDEGRAFYVGQLEAGQPRLTLLESLLRSDEFDARYRGLSPQAGFLPRDVQLCELANPAKWDNPDWLALLRSLTSVPADKASMHRKAYEFAQLLFGLTRLGALGEETQVLSVGAGHEPVLYWLANRARRVVATDMYGGVWQAEGAMEGDTQVFSDPAQFAPFPYREDRLVFLKMDGRFLAFPEASFDVVYSLSSIEHFGGFDGARAAVAEMARVLKPGGVMALATEYCLAGPAHHEAFQPAQVHALVDHPLLALAEPIDERVWRRYAYVAIDLRVNPHQTPHMVVTDLGSEFTSVMVFLRKQGGGPRP